MEPYGPIVIQFPNGRLLAVIFIIRCGVCSSPNFYANNFTRLRPGFRSVRRNITLITNKAILDRLNSAMN